MENSLEPEKLINDDQIDNVDETVNVDNSDNGISNKKTISKKFIILAVVLLITLILIFVSISPSNAPYTSETDTTFNISPEKLISWMNNELSDSDFIINVEDKNLRDDENGHIYSINVKIVLTDEEYSGLLLVGCENNEVYTIGCHFDDDIISDYVICLVGSIIDENFNISNAYEIINNNKMYNTSCIAAGKTSIGKYHVTALVPRSLL